MAEGQETQNSAPVIVDRFKGVPNKIAREIELYEIQYFKEDLPIPLCGRLKLHPATVHDYEAFSSCSSCLTLNKNESVEGLKMSHLDYLYSMTQLPGDEGAKWSYKVSKLFEIIFHVNNGIKCTKCGRVLGFDSPEFQDYIKKVQNAQQNKEQIPELICPDDNCKGNQFIEMMKFVEEPETKKRVLYVDGQLISREDFNRLRYIVLFQNFPDYRDDSWVDADLKRDHAEKLRLERLKNDVHATLEKKIVCLSISTHYSFEDIYKMSVRKFTMALATVDDLINYKLMKQASMSGFVQWPKDHPIEHWIYKPDKDMYGDDYKALDSAVSQANTVR